MGSIFSEFMLAGGLQSGGYQIARSLRFNVADTPRLTSTSVASPTNNKICTISIWFKRSEITLLQSLLGANGNSDIRLDSTDALVIVVGGTTTLRTSNQKLRDPTAWYHLVIKYDSTQGTAADRLRVYLNGVEITSWSTNNAVTLNAAFEFNTGSAARTISTYNGTGRPFGGYVAEYNFVDGQALDPTSFGEFNLITGVWNPKKYAGSYGANGFYLDFSDNSNTTSATLGKDRSGNNNDWTPTNFSVAAGVGNDSLEDTPTSNFCTLSQLNKHSLGTCTLVNGGLQFLSSNTGNTVFSVGTMQIPTGKFYFEVTIGATAYDAAYAGVGVCDTTFACAGLITGDNVHTSTGVWKYLQNGNKKTGATITAFGSTYTTGDIIGIAIDATDQTNIKVWWSKNGTWQASGNPDTGANPAYTITTGPVWPLVQNISNSAAGGDHANFGQRPFNSTANATSFQALGTKNFPDPVEKNPTKFVNAGNRAGTGAAGSRAGALFQPNIIQNKPRNASGNNANPLTTSVRGTGKYRSMYTNGEVTNAQAITAFNSDGFSFGTAAVLNTNGTSYWDLLLKSDPTRGIEVITWTGDGNATKSISHSLGKKPGLVFAMTLGARATLPYLWFKEFAGDTYYMKDSAGYMAAEVNTNSPFSAFSASQITVTNNAANNLNANGVEHMAILLADGPLWAGGKVYGNASADGPVIHCGFKPLILAVHNNTTQTWTSITTPDDYNGNASQKSNPLWATYGAQATTGLFFDVLSNGAKLRNTGFTLANAKYWMAFADQAGKYSRAV